MSRHVICLLRNACKMKMLVRGVKSEEGWKKGEVKGGGVADYKKFPFLFYVVILFAMRFDFVQKCSQSRTKPTFFVVVLRSPFCVFHFPFSIFDLAF